MKKFLTFKYNDAFITTEGTQHVEKYVAIHLNEENGFWVARFDEETLNSLIKLGRTKGLNVLLEG